MKLGRSFPTRISLVAVFMVCLSCVTVAQNRGFGVGLLLIEPTGISAKGWVSQNNAFDVAFAWSFRNDGSFHVHFDYRWHFPNVIRSSEQFVLYTGVGARFRARHEDNTLLGIRVVGGLAYWPRGVPLDIFAEVAPIVDLAPATKLGANGGIGVRFFF
jgi:hypothetical protein